MNKQLIAIFAAGTLFGSAGFRLLASDDAKKVYTGITAAAMRCRDFTMKTADDIREACGDIAADAKDINEKRARAKAEETVEDARKTEDAE